jgi:predicted transcriptional regulator
VITVEGMEEIRDPGAQDATIEAAVLRQLLALHPIQLTLAELSREIAGEREDFAMTDAVERAVRELAAAGLVHRNGEVVLPSRAALRCEELLG